MNANARLMAEHAAHYIAERAKHDAEMRRVFGCNDNSKERLDRVLKNWSAPWPDYLKLTQPVTPVGAE